MLSLRAKKFQALAFVFGVVFLPLQTFAAGFAETYAWDTESQASPDGFGFGHSTAALSADGLTVLFGLSGGRLYISTDGGANFTETQPKGNTSGGWFAAAMDADGTHMVAAEQNQTERLYVSSNSGTSWTEVQPAGDVGLDWQAVAMDDDGSHIVAAVTGGRIYVSSNGGTSWAETQPGGDADLAWVSVAMDGDGSHLIAAVEGGRLYVSSNGGTSWTETQPVGDFDNAWLSVASDDDGSNLAVVDGADTYISTNGGGSWTAVGLPAITIASDADGSVLVAANNNTVVLGSGRVFVSKDGGGTWGETRPDGDTDYTWRSVYTDSDGSHIIASRVFISFFTAMFSYFGLSMPYLYSTTPANGAIGVATDADLTLTFSEEVSVNTGNITIYDASDDSVFETIDVTSGAVTGVNTFVVTVNPTSDLEEETTYYVLVDAGAVTADSNSAEFIGVNESSVWSFTTPDETAPTLTSVNPSDGAVDASTHTNLELTFSEDVVASSTGTITIKKTADDSTVQVIDVSDSDVNISGNDVVVGITVLEPETAYAVQISAGAFQDAAGNDYAGISDLTTWNFTTAGEGSSSSGSSSKRQTPPEGLSSQSMSEHERVLTLLITVLQELIELLIEEQSA